MHTLIVGAGSAGCVIAARLSESGNHEVTLVESGPDYPSPQDTPEDLRDGRKNSMDAHDWRYRYRPTSQRKVTFAFPRGKVVGGSSAVNTCIALRGHPYDYDEWAARGLGEWSFAKCLPAFKRLERDLDFTNEWHGASGPIPIRRHPHGELVTWQAAFVEAAKRAGYPPTVDHNNPELPCGVGPHAMNKVGGERMSAARCYLTPAVRRRPNLHVRAQTLVRRIVFLDKRFSAIEVERDGVVETITADRLVLAAGAIGTPGILLRSGIGPRAELARLGVDRIVDSPSVARRMIDHPGAAILLAPRRPFTDYEQPVLQTMARATSIGSDHPFDLQLQPGSWLPIFGLDLPIVALMTNIGKPDGSGTLHFESADPHARPIIDARLLDHPRDVARVIDGLERLFELARQPELAELAYPIYPGRRTLSKRALLQEFLPKVTGSGYHPCGTVPMSATDIEEGAVDEGGRVRGVRGVVVGDASIMPTIPSANTNLASIMIGERVGEWLRDGMDL
ncbi:MAG: NAD(P)-binding protein [Polyangiaceae bacterium]|nr:NAD(P)-binding protein [Polyangiaceae bacterium]